MNGLARLLALLALILAAAALVLRLAMPPGEQEETLIDAAAEGAPPAQADPVRFAARGGRALQGPEFDPATGEAFARVERGQEAAAASPARSLYAPLQLRASAQEGGLRLTWQPHPKNPVAGKIYRLTRWTGDGAAELVAETSALEHFDPVACEEIPYHYRLQAVVTREILGGERVARKSPAAAASAQLTRTTRWDSPGLDPQGRILLVAEHRGRPRKGPFPATPGEEVGDTRWFLEDLRLRETVIQVETRTPRFDALGRRVIIEGRPADRVREVSANRILATVRLSDPCGSSWSLEMLLPEEPGETDR